MVNKMFSFFKIYPQLILLYNIMLYKNRIAERRSSPTGVITYHLPTCFCLHQSVT